MSSFYRSLTLNGTFANVSSTITAVSFTLMPAGTPVYFGTITSTYGSPVTGIVVTTPAMPVTDAGVTGMQIKVHTGHNYVATTETTALAVTSTPNVTSALDLSDSDGAVSAAGGATLRVLSSEQFMGLNLADVSRITIGGTECGSVAVSAFSPAPASLPSEFRCTVASKDAGRYAVVVSTYVLHAGGIVL